MTTEHSVALVIPIALCPMSLSKNGRTHWRTKHGAFQSQKRWVIACMQDEIATETLSTDAWPWYSARMHVNWQYNRGRHPDPGNAFARLEPTLDAFQSIGIVENDMYIALGTMTFTKVKQTDDPVAVVTLEAV